MAARRVAGDDKSAMMVELDDSFRTMKWFLNTMLLKIIIAASGANLLNTLVKENRFPLSFRVLSHTPSKDKLGCPYYSQQVIDFAKLKDKFPAVYEAYQDKDATYLEKGMTNQFIRSHYADLLLDSMSTNGVLNPEFVTKYQLGELGIEVTEWMAAE